MGVLNFDTQCYSCPSGQLSTWIWALTSEEQREVRTLPECTISHFQEPLFAARVIYDLLFFFMVIIIVLNLIFGVIIDTFADLRSEKQKKEEILKTTCFICGEYLSHSGMQTTGQHD